MQKNELKIALVSLQKDAERVPPMGLVYIATYLRDKVGLAQENIKIFDSNFDEKIIQEVVQFKPDIIGVGAMTVIYQKAVAFASSIRKYLSVPILIGGVHISTLPESFKPCFDIGIIGEGEETLQELINLYLKNKKFEAKKLKKVKSIIFLEKKKLFLTKPREPIDLNILPIPDFKFSNPEYFKSTEIASTAKTMVRGYVISSRGCPYRCIFCSTSRFWKKMRFHSPEYTAKTIKKQMEDFNARHFAVVDDLFTVSPERLNSLCEAFKKEGILDKLDGLDATARANLITEDLCNAMKKIKIKTLNFGFETGSDRILNRLKVGSVTVAMNKKAIIIAKRNDFMVYGSLMYGSPGEKIEDMKKTNDFIDFCAKNGADNIWSFVATPFPSTPFWDVALERGTVSNNMNFDLLSHHNFQKPLLLDPDISVEEFNRVYFIGKKKLRNMRIKLIKRFILKNPSKVIEMVFNEPSYWAKRIFRQLFKQ